ncbi:hypothetical protein L7F22_008353 [Adiantum nelumboides]|nr:hypothetical protein [Adiantum nelumboides]
MPREIWTLHRRPEVASAVRAVHLEQFFRLPPWGTDYMRAHELMSSIQYDGKAMLTDSDGSKVEVLITKEIINEALQFQPGTYNLIPKTKAIDNEKAFFKVKGNKFKYFDLIYTVKTTNSAASSRSTRSRKDSSDEERIDTDKDQDSDESDREDIPKEAEAAGPSEYERSDEEDTSTPLEKKSQKPRSREQVLMDEAMARVKARRKELADAMATKAAKTAKPTTMEEAKKLRMEKAKALQKERKRLEAEEGAQEEAERAAQLAREKIKDALSRKAEANPGAKLGQSKEAPTRGRGGNGAHPRKSNSIISNEYPSYSSFLSKNTISTCIHPKNTSISINSAPLSPQQQQPSAKPAEAPPSIQEETDQSMDITEEEKKQTDSDKPKPAEIDLQIPLMQLEEPTHEEAYEDVKNFDYTKIILTLSRTALELVTQERDTNAKDNENLLRDSIDL